MDDDRFHAELSADLGGMCRHRFVRFFARREAQHFADLAAFLQVETEDDFGVLLEPRDEVDCSGDVLPRALGRIGQVEENPARLGDQRHHFPEQFLENACHTRQHRPIDQRDERRVVEKFDQTFERDVPEEDFPVHLAQAEVLAEHQLPVVELDGVGVTGFGQRNHLGPRGEVGKDRVDIRRPEVAHIGHRRTVGAERVGHDRAVAAEFDHLRHHLEIRAQPGSGADSPAEFGHAPHAGVALGALPRGHHVQDGVHEAVQTDQAGGLRQGVGA